MMRVSVPRRMNPSRRMRRSLDAPKTLVSPRSNPDVRPLKKSPTFSRTCIRHSLVDKPRTVRGGRPVAAPPDFPARPSRSGTFPSPCATGVLQGCPAERGVPRNWSRATRRARSDLRERFRPKSGGTRRFRTKSYDERLRQFAQPAQSLRIVFLRGKPVNAAPGRGGGADGRFCSPPRHEGTREGRVGWGESRRGAQVLGTLTSSATSRLVFDSSLVGEVAGYSSSAGWASSGAGLSGRSESEAGSSDLRPMRFTTGILWNTATTSVMGTTNRRLSASRSTGMASLG